MPDGHPQGFAGPDATQTAPMLRVSRLFPVGTGVLFSEKPDAKASDDPSSGTIVIKTVGGCQQVFCRVRWWRRWESNPQGGCRARPAAAQPSPPLLTYRTMRVKPVLQCPVLERRDVDGREAISGDVQRWKP